MNDNTCSASAPLTTTALASLSPAEVFDEIQKGGMQALMKFMNDPKTLAKLGEKLGDVPVAAQSTAAPTAAAAPSQQITVPDIDNLFDAAR